MSSVPDSHPYKVKTAVLVVAFNRPEETANLINLLREVKPERIYFAVDGARASSSSDRELVNETRFLLSNFDWDCTVFQKFPNENLGCGRGVSSAVSWALESEETIIVLEDDIAPKISFFQFCDELLEKYRFDENVFCISGHSSVPSHLLDSSVSYRFSRYPNVWGWATWKRSWDSYNFDISNWEKELPKAEMKRFLGKSSLAMMTWSRVLNLIAAGKIDTWDYQLVLAQWRKNAYAAIPNCNLTNNVGFSKEATHTNVRPKYLIEATDMVFPLVHAEMRESIIEDQWTLKWVHGANMVSFSKSLLRYMRRTVMSKLRA